VATISERTKKVIMNKLGVNEASIVPTASFTADLGADSLDLVELIMAFEEEFSTPEKQVKIPDEDANKLKTVQAVNEYLAALNIA
jgi:acyl carrier protein